MKHFALAIIASALCTTAFAQSKVKNIYASTEKLNVEVLQNDRQDVQLNRYLFAGYNTLCLPMNMTQEQLGDIRVERLEAIRQEGHVLNLYFVDCTSEGIQAGVPYLVYSPKSQFLRVKNSEAIVNDELTTIRLSDGQGNSIAFGSSWNTVRKDGYYGIPAQQNVTPLESVLIRTEADKSFLPTRCGFNWEQQSATATDLRIVHASAQEATAIKGINTEAIAEKVYDLQGRQVVGQKKGIAISGGKKVLVK